MYRVDKSTKIEVFQQFGKTEETVQEDVEKIKKWMEEESVYPEIMSDTRITNMLTLCKFNIEKTKKKINFYYNARELYPDFFDNCNPKLPKMKKAMKENHLSTHPELLNGLYRIMFMKPKAPDTFSPRNITKIFFNIYEMRLKEDFMNEDIMVFDWSHFSVKCIAKLTPLIVYRAISAYKNVFSMRLKAIYYVNSPSYLDVFLKLIKLFVKPKIFDRIEVYTNAEILKTIFPIDVLPEDYGGNGLSLEKLDEIMIQGFEKHQERFDELDNLRNCENQ